MTPSNELKHTLIQLKFVFIYIFSTELLVRLTDFSKVIFIILLISLVSSFEIYLKFVS